MLAFAMACRLQQGSQALCTKPSRNGPQSEMPPCGLGLGQGGEPLAAANHDLVTDSANRIPGRSRIPKSAKD
jgi:hypothetical protein